jgi:hypothetical protein
MDLIHKGIGNQVQPDRKPNTAIDASGRKNP